MVKGQGTRDSRAVTADSVTASIDHRPLTEQQGAWAGDRALTDYRMTDRCQIIVGILTDHGLTDHGPGAMVTGSWTGDHGICLGEIGARMRERGSKLVRNVVSEYHKKFSYQIALTAVDSRRRTLLQGTVN